MILQELLKNIVFYKDLIKPILRTWTESLYASYSKSKYRYLHQNAKLNLPEPERASNKAVSGKEMVDSACSLMNSEMTGTLTMSYFDATNQNEITIGNIAVSMLVQAMIYEYAVKSGKTRSRMCIANNKVISNTTVKTLESTTGYTKKEVNPFLITKTHEEREYLGEFSLTHEEVRLSKLKEGGEYHGIDEESITTVI
jgi:hypothetical protein